MDEPLVACSILARGDFSFNQPLCFRQYPCVLHCLPSLGIWDCLPEGHKNSVLSSWGVQGAEEGAYAPPKLLCVLPQGSAVRAPQDHLII